MGKKKYIARFRLRKFDPPLEKILLHEVIIELMGICYGLGLSIQDDGENYVFSIEFADESVEVISQVKDLIERKNRESLSAEEALETAGIQESTVPPGPNPKHLSNSSLSDNPPPLMDRLFIHLKRMKDQAIELLFDMGDRLEGDGKEDGK